MQQIDSLKDNFNLQIKTISESYTQQFKIYNDKTDDKITSIQNELNTKESRLEELINNSLKEMLNLEKEIKRDAARIKVNLWDGREVFRNSLSYRIEELLHLIELDQVHEFYLKDLIDNLNKLSEIDKYDSGRVTSMLDKIIDPKFEELKVSILEIIKIKFKE